MTTRAIRPADDAKPAARRSGRGSRGRTIGRPRALDSETIIRVAIRIANSDGVPALTMSRLASELGVASMTLYTYVSTKDQLINDVYDAALGQATQPVPAEDPSQWREVVHDAFIEFYDVLLAHWTLVETAGTQVSIGPAVTGWLESVLRVLEAAGFDPDEMALVFRKLVTYTLGEAHLRISYLPGLEASWTTNGGIPLQFGLVGRIAKSLQGQSAGDHYAHGLRRLLDSVRSPGGSDDGRAVLHAVPLRSAPTQTATDESAGSASTGSVAEHQAQISETLAEVRRLRLENRELRRATGDILKVASTYFTAELDDSEVAEPQAN